MQQVRQFVQRGGTPVTKCLHCGAVRYLSTSERVSAFRARCLQCGRPLEPIIGKQRAKQIAREIRPKNEPCAVCGQRFATRMGAALHLQNSQKCRGKLVVKTANGVTVLRGSAFTTEVEGNWEVYGIGVDGRLIELGTTLTEFGGLDICEPFNAEG